MTFLIIIIIVVLVAKEFFSGMNAYSENDSDYDERNNCDFMDEYEKELQHNYERNFGFYDFAGYWRRFDEKFIDGQKNYASWEAFQDREGRWYSGDSFRDGLGNWASLDEGFYDWKGNWVRGR